jgi:hypothetical protein
MLQPRNEGGCDQSAERVLAQRDDREIARLRTCQRHAPAIAGCDAGDVRPVIAQIAVVVA